MRELEGVWQDVGIETPLRRRIRISTTYCTVGNFGSEDRMDYTIVGAGVNITARLEHAASPRGILISTDPTLGRQPIREQLPNARIELNLAAMSEDERREAVTALRRVLERLAALDPTSPPYPVPELSD